MTLSLPTVLLLLLFLFYDIDAFGTKSPSPLSTLTLTPSSTVVLKNSNNNNNNNDIDDDDKNVDRGLNLLGVASKFVPQGNIVKVAKFGWKFIWLRFMTELAPQDNTGSYKRPSYGFDNCIGDVNFPIESGRYHIYVGNPCPWCHRVRLVVNTLQLQSVLHGVTVLIDNPERASRGGWIFDDNGNNSHHSSSKNDLSPPKFQDLRELYDHLTPGGVFTGRCTAPLLVDWETKRIVSNESKDIVRMLPLLLQAKNRENSEQEQQENNKRNNIALDPRIVTSDLQSTVDERNEWIYKLINNGVYRCGFATTQIAYNEASQDVVMGLSKIEEILSSKEGQQKYMCSNTQFTESDVMLLPTLLRFDGVYSSLFKAGGIPHIRLECDYPYTFQYMKRCWNTIPGVKESIDIDDACQSYYKQLFPLNPGAIVPSFTPQVLRLEE